MDRTSLNQVFVISAKVGYYVHSYILTSIFDRDVGQSRASRQQEKIIIIVCTWNVVHIIIRLTQWLLSTCVQHSHDLLGLHTRLDKLLLCQLAVLVQVEALEQLGGAPGHRVALARAEPRGLAHGLQRGDHLLHVHGA